MKYEKFRVTETIDLSGQYVSNNEALFFFDESQEIDDLILIAHDMVLDATSNYKKTEVYREIQAGLDLCDTETKDWLIDTLSEYVDECYDLKNHYCGFNDGNWGMWSVS